jgi:hypothetical protein
MSVSAEDVAILRRIQGGEVVFKPASNEAADSIWLRTIQRLRSLRDRGLIDMREPKRSFMSRAGGYVAAGPCELTAAGYDLLDQMEPPA